MGKLTVSRRYNLLPLLRSSPGGFRGSWPYRTYPVQRYIYFPYKALHHAEKNANFAFLDLSSKTARQKTMAERKIIKINVLQVTMTMGTWLGLYQTVKLLSVPLGVSNPGFSLLFPLLAIGSPFFAWYLIRRFRDRTTPKFFPFSMGWMITLLTYLFATMLSCMVAYLYLRYVDKGALFSQMSKMFHDSSELLVASGMTQADASAQIARITEFIDSLTVVSAIKELISNSLFWGSICALVIAAVTAKYGGLRRRMREGEDPEEIMRQLQEMVDEANRQADDNENEEDKEEN